MAKNTNKGQYRDYRVSKRGLYVSIFVIVFVIVGSFLISKGYLKIPNLNNQTDTNISTQATETKNATPVEIKDGEYLKVHYIDVGQGDSILVENVENGEKQYMLIDAGTSKNHTADVILNYLDKMGVKKLKYFIITHPHSDHAAAADNVIKAVDIEKVFIPDCIYSTTVWNKVLTELDKKTSIDVEIVDKNDIGDKYKLGKAEFTILWPENPSVVKEDDINEVSIVIRMVYGENAFMFTGDAEAKNEKQIISNKTVPSLKCDVLKAGHHGSNTASCEEFVNAVNPSIVIISCGKGNSYNHPHKEPMELFESKGCQILRTDLLGTIVLVSDGKNIEVQK